jgi:DNA-directed RNA polymerase specialized sigma24 family protein
MVKPRARVNYVDNKKLYGVMIHFINECKRAEAAGDHRPKVPEYVGECIYKIASRLSYKPNFASYTYRDEMVSEGMEVCIRYIHNFDPEKSNNPFAYFTQIIYFAFLQRIQKEKKQQYIKAESFKNSVLMNTLVHDPTGRYFDTYYHIDAERLHELESKVVKKSVKKVKPKGIEAIIGDDDE